MFKGKAEESGCSTVLTFGSMKANQNYGNPLLNPLRTVGSLAKLKSSSGLLCSSLKSAITWLGGINFVLAKVLTSFACSKCGRFDSIGAGPKGTQGRN